MQPDPKPRTRAEIRAILADAPSEEQALKLAAEIYRMHSVLRLAHRALRHPADERMRAELDQVLQAEPATWTDFPNVQPPPTTPKEARELRNM
jgi:hypothetical protein